MTEGVTNDDMATYDRKWNQMTNERTQLTKTKKKDTTTTTEKGSHEMTFTYHTSFLFMLLHNAQPPEYNYYSFDKKPKKKNVKLACIIAFFSNKRRLPETRNM